MNRLLYLNVRTVTLFAFYLLVSVVAYLFAYELRFDFDVPERHAIDRNDCLWWFVGFKLVVLVCSGQLNCILSYFRLPDAFRLFAALTAAMCIYMFMWYLYGGVGVPPRGVIISDFQLSLLLLCGFRVAARVRASRSLQDWLIDTPTRNVIIIGAGEVGASVCDELRAKPRLNMRPVAFLDDKSSKIGRYLHGVLVADRIDELEKVAKRFAVEKVILAIPSASAKRIQDVIRLATAAGLEVDRVPALGEIISGRARMTQLKPVELEDLLGRDAVDLNSDSIREMIVGKRVLVTGAGGSIGRELVVQILDYQPEQLICVDQTEIAVFNLKQEVLDCSDASTAWETRVLDVTDADAMRQLFDQQRPEMVFHAAAHKHVNLMEAQPVEALKNNFVASWSLARLASEYAVERFILISTDKAINPTSVMGASKRLAELALQVQQRAEGNATKFMCLRFGNVLGSSGSVIPIFRRQIEAGGPLTVTDPEVTRFFMTVQEAVGLVLQAGTQGVGGEIFVLDMGASMKIVDVARKMLQLSGLQEGEDIEIVFTGLRPGEKLYEEVQHLSEELKPTSHARIMRFVAEPLISESMLDVVSHLTGAEAVALTSRELKLRIQNYIPEYTPHLD